jgi:hypothetical protein
MRGWCLAALRDKNAPLLIPSDLRIELELPDGSTISSEDNRGSPRAIHQAVVSSPGEGRLLRVGYQGAPELANAERFQKICDSLSTAEPSDPSGEGYRPHQLGCLFVDAPATLGLDSTYFSWSSSDAALLIGLEPWQPRASEYVDWIEEHLDDGETMKVDWMERVRFRDLPRLEELRARGVSFPGHPELESAIEVRYLVLDTIEGTMIAKFEGPRGEPLDVDVDDYWERLVRSWLDMA